ncbi:uncharacterized protein L201_002500 [Kwoniella dendrophila CBS 6074]|uniref:Uncharacterized protein n=1 Tax=Kwoniella dendrophila CBS 6074 TaxID=1295534 RepID=A0AAX4JQB9_9TREE
MDPPNVEIPSTGSKSNVDDGHHLPASSNDSVSAKDKFETDQNTAESHGTYGSNSTTSSCSLKETAQRPENNVYYDIDPEEVADTLIASFGFYGPGLQGPHEVVSSSRHFEAGTKKGKAAASRDLITSAAESSSNDLCQYASDSKTSDTVDHSSPFQRHGRFHRLTNGAKVLRDRFTKSHKPSEQGESFEK